LLIQQNKFYSISNRSGVAKLIQTVTEAVTETSVPEPSICWGNDTCPGVRRAKMTVIERY